MQHKGLRNTLFIHVHYVEMLLISTILYYSERTNRFNMNSLLLCSITVLVKLISNTFI